MTLFINKFLPYTRVEGPGLRACIWVQGCPIQCEKCMVPETWNLNDGKEVSIEELSEIILNLHGIEGVTFSGGEPFFQAKNLFKLGKILKNNSDLSIVTFTGYSFKKIIEAKNENYNKLIEITDLLIDGPYDPEYSSEKKPWTGSSNQEYYFLTDRYFHLKSNISHVERKIELIIHPNGEVSVNGVTRLEDLDQIQKNFLKMIRSQ